MGEIYQKDATGIWEGHIKRKKDKKKNRDSYLKRSKEKKGLKRKKERKNVEMKIMFIWLRES